MSATLFMNMSAITQMSKKPWRIAFEQQRHLNAMRKCVTHAWSSNPLALSQLKQSKNNFTLRELIKICHFSCLGWENSLTSEKCHHLCLWWAWYKMFYFWLNISLTLYVNRNIFKIVHCATFFHWQVETRHLSVYVCLCVCLCFCLCLCVSLSVCQSAQN